MTCSPQLLLSLGALFHAKLLLTKKDRKQMTNFQNVLAQRIAAKKGKKNGFTLIELMVVVAIVGVLTAVGLPELTKAQDRAKDSAAQATLTNAAKECSLSLILNGDDSEYEDDTDGIINPAFADVTGACAIDGTLAIESKSTEATAFEIEFIGSTPGVVAAG